MRLAVAVLLVMVLGVRTADAQKTNLTVTGFPVAFPVPSGTDFAALSITSASSITFSVATVSGKGQRTTTVSIRCGTPCPTTGTKSVSSLQWRRSDVANGWTTLTTSDAAVETRVVQTGTTNDPWSNSLFFRFNLSWTGDAPSATANSYNIIMTLTVTVP